MEIGMRVGILTGDNGLNFLAIARGVSQPDQSDRAGRTHS